LQNALANEILAGNFPEGSCIHIDAERDGFIFTAKPATETVSETR